MEKLARILFPSLLLAAIFTALAHFEPFSAPDPSTDSFLFEARLESTAEGPARLFFDRGAGFSLVDSFATQLTRRAGQTCRFLVPPGTHRAFRIEALAPGELTLRSARVVDLHGREAARFSPAEFKTAEPQDIVEQRENGARIRTGGRAGAVLEPAKPLILSPAIDARQAALLFVCAAAACALLLWKVAPRLDPHREKIARTILPLAERARENPALTQLATAALAVVVSCHPVVFFGKSFVSPNNRTTCLYEDFPTLPGAPAGPLEDPKFSDVGAMMWSHLPYSIIEHRAIFRDHELPLWNRFNSCGVPLLAQGQSMIGDPLHWLAIAADGATWAWDLKFLLAKILFAFGIGLVVREAAGSLGIAAALAASSAFIGFFSYRLNHPAFFSLSYAPLILFAWLKIVGRPHRLPGQAERPPYNSGDARSPARRWLALLVAANWIELNSGTAKEATMLIAGMNFAGALALFLAREPLRNRAKKLALAGAALIAFVLLSAPCWLVFLDALRHAWTSYNTPRAYQIQPSLLLGLFDDLFYRQTTLAERHTNPAANFFVLLGVLWAAARARRLASDRTFLALALSAAAVAAFVFGVVSPRLITRLPFIGNITHLDNTFSCVLIVLLFPLAGFGLRACRDAMREPAWLGDWLVTLLFGSALAAAFFGYIQVATRVGFALIHETGPVPKSAFFIGYATALFCALALLPLAAKRLQQRRGGSLGPALLAAICLFAMHFRGLQFLQTKFDPYVVNPQDRIDLRAPSPAVEFVKAHLAEPARVAGFGGVLTPGFNPVLGLESPSGSDPLSNPLHRELLEAAKIQIVWDWRMIAPKTSAHVLLPFYDLLGIRYFLGTPGEPPAGVAGMKLIGSRDLDVFESPTVWPRAFFTDTLASYRTAPEFARMVWESERRPLAAAQASETIAANLPADLPARRVVPARDYALTSNRTSFTIHAPAAGVAVLGENFETGNFRVTINGAPAEYFRVNHAFKGVLIPAAGHYAIRFTYRPRLLTPALWLALGGLVVLGALLFTGRDATPAAAPGVA